MKYTEKILCLGLTSKSQRSRANGRARWTGSQVSEPESGIYVLGPGAWMYCNTGRERVLFGSVRSFVGTEWMVREGMKMV